MLFTGRETEYFWMGGKSGTLTVILLSPELGLFIHGSGQQPHLILSAETHKEKNKILPSNKDVLLSQSPQQTMKYSSLRTA